MHLANMSLQPHSMLLSQSLPVLPHIVRHKQQRKMTRNFCIVIPIELKVKNYRTYSAKNLDLKKLGKIHNQQVNGENQPLVTDELIEFEK